MARTSLPATFAELVGLLTGMADVAAVYDHEPANREMLKPVAVTLFCTGWTPDFWQVALRVYVDPVDGAEAAQERLWGLAASVEERLTAGYGPSEWAFGWDEPLGLLVGTLSLSVGRQDYY